MVDVIGVIGLAVLVCLVVLALTLFVPRRRRRVLGREDRIEKAGPQAAPPGPVSSKERNESGEKWGR